MAWEGDLGVKTNQYEGDNAINYVGDPNLKQCGVKPNYISKKTMLALLSLDHPHS